jgi:hypothetical protein
LWSDNGEQEPNQIGEIQLQPCNVDRRLAARYKELAAANPPFDTIHHDVICAILSAPGAESFGNALCQADPASRDCREFNLDTYTHAIRNALGVESSGSGASRVAFYFKLFSQGFNSLTREAAKQLVLSACALAIASGAPTCTPVPSADSAIIKAVVDAMFQHAAREEEITMDEFMDFTSSTFPDIFKGAMKWIELQGLSTQEEGSQGGNTVWTVLHCLPDMVLPEDARPEQLLLTYPAVWTLMSSLPDIFKTSEHWTLLYNTNLHGHSSNRFRHHVHNYAGPTLFMFRLEKGAVIGVAIDTEWRDKASAWGGDHSRIFSLLPGFKMHHRHIQVYENEKTRHVEHGIGFGAAPSSSATAEIWLQDDLQSVIVRADPLGSVVNPYTDKIHAIEVWGCGSKEVSHLQQQRRNRDHLTIEQKQKVKRIPGWAGEDRFLLDLAGLNICSHVDVEKERKHASGDVHK